MSSGFTNSGKKRERGIALLVVVWVLALLAVLIVGFSGDARTELLLARNNYANAGARAIADAGVSLAIFGILDPVPETQWPADGRQRVLRYGDGTIRVSVQDEGGKIDLNAAPPELMAGLLRTVGLGPADAARLAQTIDEWRQPQQQAVAPPAARRGAARALVRRQANAFRVVEDLRLVPGVTREIYDRVAPFVTVYSGIAEIDPLTAPPQVLRSLPGANAAEVEDFLSARQRLGPVPGQLPTLTGATGGFLAHRVLQNATVVSEGKTAGGTTFTRVAVLSLSADPSAPYSVLSWRQAKREPHVTESGE